MKWKGTYDDYYLINSEVFLWWFHKAPVVSVKDDAETFLFTLTNPHNMPPTKISNPSWQKKRRSLSLWKFWTLLRQIWCKLRCECKQLSQGHQLPKYDIISRCFNWYNWTWKTNFHWKGHLRSIWHWKMMDSCEPRCIGQKTSPTKKQSNF